MCRAVSGPGGPPRSPTPLVGRAADLYRVTDFLATHRLVSLTGAGGSGKTRLALEVLARHPTRVAFADLAPVSTDSDVIVTIANALGLEAELARRYDELSRTLDQGRAPMSLAKRNAADQAMSRAMDSVLELEEYAVMRAFVER